MLILILPQIETSDDPGQGAVRDVTAVLALQDLLDPDDIALGVAEGLPKDGRKLLVRRLSLRPLLPLPPDHPSDRVPGDLKDLADLPELDSPLRKT